MSYLNQVFLIPFLLSSFVVKIGFSVYILPDILEKVICCPVDCQIDQKMLAATLASFCTRSITHFLQIGTLTKVTPAWAHVSVGQNPSLLGSAFFGVCVWGGQTCVGGALVVYLLMCSWGHLCTQRLEEAIRYPALSLLALLS